MQYTSSSGADPTWLNRLPNVEESVNKHHLHEFFNLMFERQQIWYKRFIKKLPSPWTKNPVLRDYKFTNVYRELDRHSQWQINNIIKNDELSRRDLIWQMMLFRVFNKPETFEYIEKRSASGKWYKKAWERGLPKYEQFHGGILGGMLSGIRSKGKNPFTNAYLINSRACLKKTRDWCYCNVIVPAIHRAIPEISKLLLVSTKPEEIIDFLIKLPGVANFVAYEFYLDFCYVRKYTERNLMRWDENSYTNVGPGASLGIRLIFPSLKSEEQKIGIYMLKDMAPDYLKKFEEMFKYLYWNREAQEYFVSSISNITLHQVEMMLCEYSKYWKMSIGQGKQRSKFVPKTKA